MSNGGPKRHADSAESSTANRGLSAAAEDVEQAVEEDSVAEQRAENEGMPSVRPEADSDE